MPPEVLVVVPYVDGMLRRDTVEAVESSGLRNLLVRLPGRDIGAYGRLFAHLWAGPDDLILVEQDVAPKPGQLATLAGCGHDWCGYSYDYDGIPASRVLGCTRLAYRMRAAWPTMGLEAAVICDDRPRPCPWWSMDQRLAHMLLGHGLEWHVHEGWATHRGVAELQASS